MRFGEFKQKIRQFLYEHKFLKESGLFEADFYRRNYLKSSFWSPQFLKRLALAHYLLFGEERGYLPNPFFNPNYFEKYAGTKRFIYYLRDFALWHHPASEYFDSSWYLEKYSEYIAMNENPLRHFWKEGFEKNFDPSPRFDMKFFKRALSRDTWDKRSFAFDYACGGSSHMPLNEMELEVAQKKFYDIIELHEVKYITSTAKKFLVFVQAGNKFALNFNSASSPFDVLINFYEDAAPIDSAQYIFRQMGTKTTAIRKIIEVYPDLFLRYEAVLFIDDDVEISQEQICALFQTQSENGLDLVQCSLSVDSSCFFSVLKQPLAGTGVRRISGVEIMMPVISRRALQECGWVFGEGISGWGIDMLLSAEVRRRFGNSIALFADVVAIHEREVDTANNAFYKFLTNHNINPTAEAGRIAMKFSLNDKVTNIAFIKG